MKVNFEKNILINAVQQALGCVSGKNTIPAIEGVRLKCMDGKCEVSSYDLEKGFVKEIECGILTEGDIVINGQRLAQIVKALPTEVVNIDVDDNLVCTISSGKTQLQVHAISAQDFPRSPSFVGYRGIEIKRSFLAAMFDQVNFAIAQNNMRPELNGAFIKFEDNKLTMVSCDGSKMAVIEYECNTTDVHDETKCVNFKCIIPGKTINELMKLMGRTEDTMQLRMTDKTIIFDLGDSVLYSRLIDYQYIDYERLIPKQSKIFVNVPTVPLEAALQRALLVTDDRTMGQARSVLKVQITDNLFKIESTSATSKIQDEIACEKEGEDIEIGFNCRYLTDALHSCDSETIRLSLSGQLMPMLIEPVDMPEGHKFTYMVLPVKM